MEKVTISILFIILISVIISIYFYPTMSDKMISHWNSQGEPDEYMSKFWALTLLPIISLLILILFLLIPKIDPLRKNIEKFRKYFNGLIIIIIIILFYIYLLTIFANLGYNFNMTKMILPALGILFFYLGILINNAKRNWFVGIRTPWTLSSDQVWNQTHKVSAKLFKVSGILTFIGIFFEKYAILFSLIPIMFSAIFSLIYSYYLYQKIKK